MNLLDKFRSSGRSEAGSEEVLRRGVGSVALLGIALVHVLDLPGKLTETPYLGVAYLLLIAAALVVAELLLRRGGAVAWVAAGLLGGATIVGFVVNRTVGMPGAMDDIGNWSEPLGVASLFVEGLLVLLAAVAITRTGATVTDAPSVAGRPISSGAGPDQEAGNLARR